MAAQPKNRVQVAGNLAVIARTRKMDPVDPADPAIAFKPPTVSVEELMASASSKPPREAEAPTAPTELKSVDASDPSMKGREGKPEPERPGPEVPTGDRSAPPYPQKKPVAAQARINRTTSPDYSRVALQLHNDVVTKLFAISRSQGKRYTALMEEYIMAGLARHKD